MRWTKFELYPLQFTAACFGLLVVVALWLSPNTQTRIQLVIVEGRLAEDPKPSYINIKLPKLKLASPAEALPDFTQYPLGEPRKQAFSTYLAPLIQLANTHQLAVRQAALLLAEQPHLSDRQLSWLAQLCKQYRIEKGCTPSPKLVETLKLKVDAVPVALAIAQGAKESGWGTSRFAREGNNLFGQWCFKKGCGLVPKNRLEEASHEVAAFKSPQAAVVAYILNLNSHPAYKALRSNRAANAQQQTPALVKALTQGLVDYSERGQPYVDELNSLIRSNGNWLSYPPVRALSQP